MAKYLIEIRAVGVDQTEWVRYRATDCGWLPNNAERRQLEGAVRTNFFEQYGHNCEDASLVVMPLLPDDGSPPDWRELAATTFGFSVSSVGICS